MTIVIDFGNILYWVGIIFAAIFGLAIVVFIWASLMNLAIAFFGLDDPKRFAPSPELPVSSAGFGWFLLAAAIVVALAVATIK